MEETVVKKSFKLKGILVIVFTVLILAVIGFLVYEYIRIAPSNVHFTNVSSSSVTVSWSTKYPTEGAVIALKKSDHVFQSYLLALKGDIFFDTRDVREAELRAARETSENVFNDDSFSVSMDDIQTEIKVDQKGTYYTHHVEVKNLDPNAEYSFLISDGYFLRGAEDSEGLKDVKTYAVSDEVLTPVPAYGSVLDANNEEEIAIEDLYPVSDGVMYFNYLDEFSGEKSEVYSSSFNGDGNWYMDVSGILDEDGVLFMQRFEDTVTNILVELVVDAGPWGVWKKVVYLGETSPADDIVINIPNATQEEDAPGAVVRIDSLTSEVVKGASAQQDSGCLWVGYCSCGFYSNTENKWLSCPCDTNKLKARNCSGQTDPQKEADNIAAGQCSKFGIVNDSCYIEDSTCKQCKTIPNKTSPQWVSVNSNMCNGFQNKTVRNCVIEEGVPTELKIISIGQFCDNANGCKCYIPGQGDKEYNNGIRCQPDLGTLIDTDTSIEGGSCDIYFSSVKYTGSWKKTSNQILSCDVSGQSCGVNRVWEWDGTKSVCKDTGTDGIPMISESSDEESCINGEVYGEYEKGSPCRCYIQNSIPNGTGGCECEDPYNPNNEGTECIKEIDNSNIFCFENGGQATRINTGGDIEVCRSNKWVKIDGNNTSDWCEDLNSTLERNPHATAVRCRSKGDVCIISSSAKTYYCDKDFWSENPPEAKIEAGSSSMINKGQKCTETTICQCDGEVVYEEDFCKQVQMVDCIKPENEGLICHNNGNTCRIVSQFKDKETMRNSQEVLTYYSSNSANTATICVPSENVCYSGTDSRNDLIAIEINNNIIDVPGIMSFGLVKAPYRACLPTSSGQSSKYFDTEFTNSKESLRSLSAILTKPILAQSPSSQYLVDTQTGMIAGIEAGTYVFEYEDELYSFDVSSIDLERNDSVLIYIDKDGNGEYDEITDLKVSDIASTINIVTLEKQYRYSLEEGLNFISLPFLVSSEEYRTASALLQKLNEVYGDKIYSISKYDGTWKIVGQNSQVYDNNDFQLLPGQGYIFKAKEDVDIVINGKPVQYESVSNSAPVSLYTGWNLVGIYGTKAKTYTAKTLIQGINSYVPTDLTADNVTRWQSDTQKYDGFQLSNEEGTEEAYGFDYPINQLESYFVRITKGRGNWQPEIAQ